MIQVSSKLDGMTYFFAPLLLKGPFRYAHDVERGGRHRARPIGEIPLPTLQTPSPCRSLEYIRRRKENAAPCPG
jgi:hypothetical protein